MESNYIMSAQSILTQLYNIHDVNPSEARSLAFDMLRAANCFIATIIRPEHYNKFQFQQLELMREEGQSISDKTREILAQHHGESAQ